MGPIQGILDSASDVDYFSFPAEAGRLFGIEVGLDTVSDTILTPCTLEVTL